MSTKKYTSAAERQRAHRQRVKERLAGLQPVPVPPLRKPKPLTRPQRLARATTLVEDLLDEYQAWLEAIPANLAAGEVAEALHETVEYLQSALDALEMVDPPRGYGR